MPKVSFIAPNLCNDEHDCGPVDRRRVAAGARGGDARERRDGRPHLRRGIRRAPGINGTSGGGNIYTVVVGPHVDGARRRGSVQPVLDPRAIEARFGLTKLERRREA
jgi:hypothetical protein